MDKYQEKVNIIFKGYLQRVNAYENKEMMLLANKWGVVGNHLEGLMTKLSAKEIKSADQLFKLDLYKQFLSESKQEVAKFNNYATGIVTNGQKDFIDLGLASSKDALRVFTPNFSKLRKDVFQNMVGLSQEGSPLYKLFDKSYKDSVDKLTNTLIVSNTLGYNPEKTARLLAANMNGNLTRAVTIARTEQLGCMRITGIEQYRQSGVCKGWIRNEVPDACDECQDENGKHYGFDDPFETHPNCRGWSSPDVE